MTLFKFRTEYEPTRRAPIGRDVPVVLLGSCFSDEIGSRLERDGFHAVHNPLGPLYNPLSLARTVTDALKRRQYGVADLVEGPRGLHCLDFASLYSGTDGKAIADTVNADLTKVSEVLAAGGPKVLIATFGTIFTFYHKGTTPVGNCHKFAASEFERRPLSLGRIVELWKSIVELTDADTRIILTVSPVRHLADGLHGNAVSKATLLLAIEDIVAANPDKCEYFPAYEILNDDLRDYRFYASDLKHPSETAAEYIYSKFCDTYFEASTMNQAEEARRMAARAAHRQILNNESKRPSTT